VPENCTVAAIDEWLWSEIHINMQCTDAMSFMMKDIQRIRRNVFDRLMVKRFYE